jgi:ABC-type proline/glycine betaine transport system permease subunit
MDVQTRQAVLDEEHLRLLRIGYFISAGVTAFFGLFGLLYMAVGTMVLFVAKPANPPSPNQMPPEFAWFFVVVGLAFMAIGLGLAALKCHVARCIAGRRAWNLCMVTAALTCLGLPYGTVLGVFTFMVLGRPTVRDLFRGVPPRVEGGANVDGGA